jgi:hypothetical protein
MGVSFCNVQGNANQIPGITAITNSGFTITSMSGTQAYFWLAWGY